MSSTRSLSFQGQVSDGFGEGAAFVDMDGYKNQFVEVLGYEPYPGTLNVVLAEDSQDSIDDLENLDPLVIEGWSNGETEFGPVYCYPATLRTDSTSGPVHVIRPVRTRHDEATLEILSPDSLRNQLGLDSGDTVTVVIDRDAES